MNSQLHSQDPIKKIVFLLFLCIIMAGLMTCCSPKTRAYKKLERAYELAPEIFNTDTISEILIANPPSAKFDFDCLELQQGDISIEIPREYEFDGETKQDTTKVSLKLDDESGKVRASIDCPPVEKEIKYIPQPYPVEKPFTDWEKFKIAFPYILGTAVIIGITLFLLFIIKKFFNITRLLP